MKPGTRVKTPDGIGTVTNLKGYPRPSVENIGKILVTLDKMLHFHFNWYYEPHELKIIPKRKKIHR